MVMRYWFDRRDDLNTRTLQALLRRNIKFYKLNKVLELGCGPGIFTQTLSKSARVVALDTSKDMLKFVKKRRIKAEPLQADIDHLPFRPNSFDAVVAYRVMEYSKDPIRTLRDFSRLAPIVFLQLPRHDSINGFRLLLYRSILAFFGSNPSFRSYSIKGAIGLGKKVGVKIKSVILYHNGLDIHMTLETHKH